MYQENYTLGPVVQRLIVTNPEPLFLFFFHKLFFPAHFDYSHLHVRAPEHQIEGKNQQECALKFRVTLCQFCLKMITSKLILSSTFDHEH